jgi:hypothetical protein
LLLGVQTNLYDGPWVGISEDLEKYNGIVRYTRSTPNKIEWNLTLMAYDAEWNSADQIPLRAVESGLVSRLGTIDDTVGGETSRYSLSGRWHRDVGEQQLTARAYAIRYELDLFSNFTYFLEDPLNGDQFEQVDDRIVYGGDLRWRTSGNDDTAHEFGLVARYDDIKAVGLYSTVRRQRAGTVREDLIAQFEIISHSIYGKATCQRMPEAPMIGCSHRSSMSFAL